MRIGVALAVVALSAGWAGSVLADPIEDRQEIMQKNQDAAKLAFDMAQGRTPFDAAKAAAAMKALQDDMKVFVTLFPPGSDKGDTAALPAVFTNFEDFKARAAKLAADAKVSEDATAKGLDAFKATLGAVGGGCQGCHDLYRKKS